MPHLLHGQSICWGFTASIDHLCRYIFHRPPLKVQWDSMMGYFLGTTDQTKMVRTVGYVRTKMRPLSQRVIAICSILFLGCNPGFFFTIVD